MSRYHGHDPGSSSSSSPTTAKDFRLPPIKSLNFAYPRQHHLPSPPPSAASTTTQGSYNTNHHNVSSNPTLNLPLADNVGQDRQWTRTGGPPAYHQQQSVARQTSTSAHPQHEAAQAKPGSSSVSSGASAGIGSKHDVAPSSSYNGQSFSTNHSFRSGNIQLPSAVPAKRRPSESSSHHPSNANPPNATQHVSLLALT